jgi:ATP adenylyltransferase
MSERPLWAPWRIEYVKQPKDDACVFCDAAAGDDAEHLVLERGARCFLLLNAFPYAPGHTMSAPYRHVGGIADLDEAELLELMTLARRATAAMAQVMSPDGYNLGLNLGEVAGAGIADHLHLHVVPRWHGDTNFMPVLADTKVIPQALADTRAALAGALRRLGEAERL